MMMLRSALVAVILCLAASCSRQGGNVPVVTPESSTTAWPAQYVWMTGVSADSAWLRFGPDESDNIPIEFLCSPSSGRITATAYSNGDGMHLTMVSGDVSGEFPARAIRDEEIYEGVKAEAILAISEPVIAEFRRSGALSASDPLLAFRTATDVELQAINAFFALCGPT